MRTFLGIFASALCCLMLAAICAACTGTPKTVLEMELTADYSDSEPFIHEKLFCVSEDMDALKLGVSLKLEGKSGLLELADNRTGEVLWSREWDGGAGADWNVTLEDVKAEKEYVVKFTGTGIQYAQIVLTAESPLVQERARPLKPAKGSRQPGRSFTAAKVYP